MEVAVFDVLLFVVGFVFLFFVPGYVFLRKNKFAEAFVVSSGVLLVGTLLLSTTIGLTWISLVAFVGIVTLAFRFANL